MAELTDLVDLSDWPEGTRLIVRREPLHPGAQQTLFPSANFRYWGHYTDQAGDPVTLDASMRAHAHVEDHIRRLKDSGLCRFPFRDLDANRAWLAVVCFAGDLVRWFQLLCLNGPLARAEPKTLRWEYQLHIQGKPAEYQAGFLDAIGAYVLTTLEGVLVDLYRWEILRVLERANRQK